MKNPVDETVRRKIQSDFSSSLFVTAGAGTGKTQSIVSRVAEAVCEKGILPERIAVTTFTEKAANELIYKIRRALEERSHEKAAHVQNMFIGTQHSFCLMLLRERPLESGIDPESEPLAEDDADNAILEIGERIIREYFDKPDQKELYTKWEFDPYSGIDFLKTLYEYRELSPVEPEDPGISMDGFWERHDRSFGEIPGLLDMNETDEPDGYDWVKRNHKKWKNLKSRTIDEIISFFLNIFIINPAKKSWSSAGLNGERSKSLVNYILRPFHEAKNEITDFISYELYKKFRALYDKFIEEYDRWKNESGVIDFEDMLIKMRDLLKNREVREYFQERFDLVVVDEFQDTDPIMSEILMYISQDGYEDVSWDKVKLGRGRITVVGDEKQSIYRFRRADISIYNRTRALFRREGKIETLTENFRSVESLVENHNYAFRRLFGQTGEGENHDGITYSDIHSFRGAATPGNSTIFLELLIDLETDTDEECKQKGDKELRADYKAGREAHAVCRWIKDAVQNKKLMIENGPAGYGDFMLLFKRRRCMKRYASLLAGEGIPVAMDGEGFLLELPEVIDLFRLIDGSVHSDSSASVVSALRSVYAGITDEELYNHALKKGKFNYYSIDNDRGDKNVNRALESLKHYNSILSRKTPEQGFRQLINKEKIKYILNRTRKVMGFNIFDSLVSFIDSCCDKAGTASDAVYAIWEEILEETKLDPSFYPFKKKKEVQLLTTYKAKGLESPVVILCDPGTDYSNRVSHIFDREEDRLYFKFGLKERSRYRQAIYDSYLYTVKSAGFEDREPEEKEAMREEDIRITYVAATRARDCLVIPTYRGKPAPLYKELHEYYMENNLFSKETYALDKDYADEEVLPLPDVQLPEAANSAAEKKADKLLSMRESILKTIEDLSGPRYRHETFSHEEALTRETAGYGQEHGSMFHRAMEIIVKNLGSDGRVDKSLLKNLIDNRLDDIIDQCRYEHRVELTPDKRKLIIKHIKSTLNSDTFTECISAEKRFAEFSIDIIENKDNIDLYRSGIIDLVYKANGSWKIIDYKTDKIDSDKHRKELEDFYTDQLNGYTDTFSRITGEKADGKLLFVDALG